MVLALLSASFQSLPLLPTSKVGPSSADSHMGGFVYVLGPCGSLQQTLLWGWEFLLLLPQPPRGFQWVVWGFIPPCLSPGLQSLFRSPFIPPGLSALKCGTAGSTSHHLLGSTSHHLAMSPLRPASHLTPPTSLDECVFFNSLVVGLPYSSIFCQFWLVCVFKLLLSFFWLCEEAQYVYLHLHLGRKSNFLYIAPFLYISYRNWFVQVCFICIIV